MLTNEKYIIIACLASFVTLNEESIVVACFLAFFGLFGEQAFNSFCESLNQRKQEIEAVFQKQILELTKDSIVAKDSANFHYSTSLMITFFAHSYTKSKALNLETLQSSNATKKAESTNDNFNGCSHVLESGSLQGLNSFIDSCFQKKTASQAKTSSVTKKRKAKKSNK
jgi:hypothetical protein